MKYFISTASISLCLLVGFNAASMAASEPAPTGNPMLAQLAEIGGAVQAAVELCDIELDTAAAKAQQEAQFVQMGSTREEFEAGYQAGYDRAKSEFEAADASAREGMCNEFRAFAQQGAPAQ